MSPDVQSALLQAFLSDLTSTSGAAGPRRNGPVRPG
jgi:hypothetical protein